MNVQAHAFPNTMPAVPRGGLPGKEKYHQPQRGPFVADLLPRGQSPSSGISVYMLFLSVSISVHQRFFLFRSQRALRTASLSLASWICSLSMTPLRTMVTSHSLFVETSRAANVIVPSAA
jgi:hypothetical protein